MGTSPAAIPTSRHAPQTAILDAVRERGKTGQGENLVNGVRRSQRLHQERREDPSSGPVSADPILPRRVNWARE